MRLESTNLRPFVGGQIEVQKPDEHYLVRGEIKKIRVEGNGEDATLIVELNWMAKSEGYPPTPKRWVKDHSRPYEASLMFYNASNIGNGQIRLRSSTIGVIIVLFPKGGSQLKRSDVEGL